MIKIKILKASFLSLLFIMFVSFALIQGCGKKNDSTGDNKTDSKTENKDENISPDKPFHVVYDLSGTTKGSVDAYYNGKKARSSSSMDFGGIKMNATAYFDGDSKIMYMVNEVAGKRTGMKMDTKAFNDSSGNKTTKWM